jgi:hypothetical protein
MWNGLPHQASRRSAGTLRPWKPRGLAASPALPAWRQALIRREGRLPLAVLLTGLLLTATIAEETRRHGQQIHEQIEKALLGDVSDAIAVKLQKATDTISGVAGLFNADNSISRNNFACTTTPCSERMAASTASRASASAVSSRPPTGSR